MTIAIHSEVGVLQQVVVHSPGDEIERMTQDHLERLLFDDILSLEEAAREHALFQEILAAGGASVLRASDLLLRALELAAPERVADLLDRVCDLSACRELAPILVSWPPERLARALIRGVAWHELGESPLTLARLQDHLSGEHSMPLRPVPNLMFMRDPCIAVGDQMLVGRMARTARLREPLLVQFALEHTGFLDGQGPLFPATDWDRHPDYRALEGGDVLVLSRRFVMIGCSQRTSAQTLERVAREALFPALPELERIYVVLMPPRRSVMHLDTILTQIDHRLFLAHVPLIAGTPGRPALRVVRLTRDRPPTLLEGSARNTLDTELGGIEVVPCGGDDPVHRDREQWTDGANAVCIAPGKIVLYSRNRHSIAELCEHHGFEEVRLSVVQPEEERQALLSRGMRGKRTVFTFSGAELSRARGGGRCLTLPLLRRALE